MIVSVKIQDLRVGMYVILPSHWLTHPFIKNRFIITSEGQIQEIRQFGAGEIDIDTSQGEAVQDVETITYKSSDPIPPEQWNPMENITADIEEAITSKKISPKKKAGIVYKHSLQLMNNLFAKPTAEIIREGKKGISKIVDLILSDDETSLHLLKITSHDFYTYVHSVNVGVLSISLAKIFYKGKDGHKMHELGAGFFLHDLGKVRIDPEIINKPARLNEKEMKIMRTHPYQGHKILKETSQLTEEARIIIFQHHEREDGTGYPRRLKGDEIHEYGRICCITDVYDALTAKRSYKKEASPFEALSIMKEQMLGHFHGELFREFVLLVR